MDATGKGWSGLALAVAVVALGAALFAPWRPSPEAARGGGAAESSAGATADLREIRARLDALEAQARAPHLAVATPPLGPTRAELADLRRRIEALEKHAHPLPGEPDASPQPAPEAQEPAAKVETHLDKAQRAVLLAQARYFAYLRPPRRPIGSAPSDVAKIDLYRTWIDADQFTSPDRPVTARMLVDWMADPDAAKAVREKAKDALMDSTARSLNPDLRIGGLREVFCLTYLVPQLRADDETARRFTAEVLDAWWYSSDATIRRYNPSDAATWDAALDVYVSILSAK